MIRQANIGDSKAIAEISKNDLGYECSEELVKERLTNLDKNREIVFVAVCDNKAVGYIHAETYAPLYFEALVNLLGLAVSKDYARRGFATELLKETEKWAKEKGINKVRVNSGSARKGAHEFYRKNGYTNEKEQIRFFKEI